MSNQIKKNPFTQLTIIDPTTTNTLSNVYINQKLKSSLPKIFPNQRPKEENNPNSLLGQFMTIMTSEIRETAKVVPYSHKSPPKNKFLPPPPINTNFSTVLTPQLDTLTNEIDLINSPNSLNNVNTKTSNNNLLNENSKYLVTESQNRLTTDSNIVFITQSNNNINSINKNSSSYCYTNTSVDPQKHSRKRTYQPRIDANWKFKAGLSLIAGKDTSYIPCLMDNIEYQAKVLTEHSKLLFENINYFKTTVIHEDNFYNAFNFMPLKTKIKFNKILEETIGILLLLPQLILMEFYHFIEKFDSVHIIDKKKLVDKIIHNENDCFNFNNCLLSDVLDFYKSSFDVYNTLVKEVDNMTLSQKKFQNVVTILEKARYNISYIVSSSKNAIDIYNSDVSKVEKILKEEHKPSLFQHEDKSLTDKLRCQFFFKKNEERQKKNRINLTLKVPVDDSLKKRDENPNDHFYSIVNSKLVTNLLKYCRKEVKEQIISDRILSEFSKSNKGKNKITESLNL